MIFIRFSTTSSDNAWRYVFLIVLIIKLASTTVDINLPELQYIADHLTHEECRKLVAALHDPGYDLSSHIDLAERKVPETTPCLNMLLHWNSAQGEGKGETHSVLSHRLIQIKRRDLARWLSNATFHDLSQNLDDTLLSDPFKDIAKSESIDIYRNTRNASNFINSMKKQCDDDEYIWNIMDTAGFILIILTAGATLVILARVLCLYGFRCRRRDDDDRSSHYESARGASPTRERPSREKPAKASATRASATKVIPEKESQAKGKQKDNNGKKKNSNKASLLCKTVEFRKDGTKEETEVLLTDASESDFDKALSKLGMQSQCNLKYVSEDKKKRSKQTIPEESSENE